MFWAGFSSPADYGENPIMAERIEDLSIEYKEDDKIIIQQIDKNILTRGNWTTIMYLFKEMDKKSGEYSDPKVSIRRYQKRNGVYRQQSKFNISSAKQGREMIAALQKWFPEGGGVAIPVTEPAKSATT